MTRRSKPSEAAVAEAPRLPIVLNNTNGPKYIPFGGVSDGTVGTVDLKRMKFASGFNAPQNAEDFAVVREFESYKSWVADGTLTEIHDVSEISEVGGACEKVIEDSASRKSIEFWRANESRPRVVALLDAKIAEFDKFHEPGGD